MAAVVAHAAERRGEVASVGAVVLAGEGHRVPGILSAERQRQIALPYRVLQRVGYERLAFEVQPAVRPAVRVDRRRYVNRRSEEHTSELQSLMRISYAVFCLKKNKKRTPMNTN